MSTSLQTLSEELLNLIISFGDLPSLAILARVSKHFNRLTVPHLYANISFVGGALDTGIQHLRPLTLLMLEQPRLSALVRTITLRDVYATEHGMDCEPYGKGWPRHPDLDITLKTAIKAQLGLDIEAATDDENDDAVENEAEKWFQIARAGLNEASILALLLPKLINLRSMDIPFVQELGGTGDGTSVRSYYIRKMFELAVTRKLLVKDRPVFSGLTDVILPGYSDKLAEDPEFLGLCLRLPSIKRIFGWNQGDDDDSGQDNNNQDSIFSRIQPNSSSVEFIELRYSKLKIFNFSRLLQAPICLKTFIYEIGNTWAWTRVIFSQIQSALNFQKNNLEKLSVSHASFFPFGYAAHEELTPLNFSDFPVLKHLRVAPIYVYGGERLHSEGLGPESQPGALPVSPEDLALTRTVLTEVLPEQLETLGLEYCNNPSTLDRLLISLREVLSCKEKRFPRLHEVCIHAIEFEMSRLEAFTVLPWKANGIRLIVKTMTAWSGSAETAIQRRWGWDEDVVWADVYHNAHGPIEILHDSQEDV